MLLDKYIPRYDFTEVHTIRIKVTPEAAYRAVEETTWAEVNGIVRLLFFIRELPERLVGRTAQNLKIGIPIMEELEQDGFTVIEKQPPHECVFGLIVPGKIGRVWNKKSGTVVPPVTNAAEFLAFNDPDYLLVIANLLIKETNTPGVVTVYTESRTMGLSHQAVKDFAPYWRIIRPGSGLIRRLWLRGIKHHAERIYGQKFNFINKEVKN